MADLRALRRPQVLADTVGFELLGGKLATDVEGALRAALAGGAVFPGASDCLSIFRESLAASIRDIETHSRGRLLQRFLRDGPYEGERNIPSHLVDRRLSDEEAGSAIAFVYSHMVNCFQGQVAEMLAAAPCNRLLQKLQGDGRLPPDARLYVGDTVSVGLLDGSGFRKGADLHILLEESVPRTSSIVRILGVGEVKSYPCSQARLRRQLARHSKRLGYGLRVGGLEYAPDRVVFGSEGNGRVVEIGVVPASWKLPRTFRFEETRRRRLLHVDAGDPPNEDDRITRTGRNEYRITLRWSKEALAAAAYEMTFWYMEKVGEVLYAEGLPEAWSEMTAAEAGRNAVKMMLYYAILRCRNTREAQRAIALYNSYGFGYALGMNFKNESGARQMLWFKDLEEIASTGRTIHNCRIVK